MEFKIRDRVRIKTGTLSGQIGFITRFTTPPPEFAVIMTSGGLYAHCLEGELEFVSQGDTFKIGDKVKIQTGIFAGEGGSITDSVAEICEYEIELKTTGQSVWRKAKDLKLVSQNNPLVDGCLDLHDHMGLVGTTGSTGEACKICNGTKKRILFQNPVDCDCVLAHTKGS